MCSVIWPNVCLLLDGAFECQYFMGSASRSHSDCFTWNAGESLAIHCSTWNVRSAVRPLGRAQQADCMDFEQRKCRPPRERRHQLLGRLRSRSGPEQESWPPGRRTPEDSSELRASTRTARIVSRSWASCSSGLRQELLESGGHDLGLRHLERAQCLPKKHRLRVFDSTHQSRRHESASANGSPVNPRRCRCRSSASPAR